MPITKVTLKEMKSSKKSWLIKGILKSINQKMLFIGNLLEWKFYIPKKFTTYNLKDTKAWQINLLELTKQSTTKHVSVNTKQILSKPGKLWGLQLM